VSIVGYADVHYGAQDAGGGLAALLAVLLGVVVLCAMVFVMLAKTVFHLTLWAWSTLRARFAARGVTP
jgi:uncharacterized protein (DUF983 family)